MCHARLQACCGLISLLLIPAVFAGVGMYNCFCSDTCRTQFLPNPADFPYANATGLSGSEGLPSNSSPQAAPIPFPGAGADEQQASPAPQDAPATAPQDPPAAAADKDPKSVPATKPMRRLGAGQWAGQSSTSAAPASADTAQEDVAGRSGEGHHHGGGLMKRITSFVVWAHRHGKTAHHGETAHHGKANRDVASGVPHGHHGAHPDGGHHAHHGKAGHSVAAPSVQQSSVRRLSGGGLLGQTGPSANGDEARPQPPADSPAASHDEHSHGWSGMWHGHSHEDEDDHHSGWHSTKTRSRWSERSRRHHDEEEEEEEGRRHVVTREDAEHIVAKADAMALEVCPATYGMVPAAAVLAVLVLLASGVLHCATAKASHAAARLLASGRADRPSITAAVLRGAPAQRATLTKGGAVVAPPLQAPGAPQEGASASAAADGYPFAATGAVARARIAERMRSMFSRPARHGYAAVDVAEDPPRASPVGAASGATLVAPPLTAQGAPMSYDEYLRAVAERRA